MRTKASVLHLDLDAFFASVEQRDKPSLRGKPVVVGGGLRSVVATASYEARVLGVHSGMSGAEAKRKAPHAAVVAGRFDAYRESSRIVIGLLTELFNVVEPLSLDEAYVDLAANGLDCSSTKKLTQLAAQVREEVRIRTEGLSASVGIGTSKFMAKLGSEASKPHGQLVIAPGEELAFITPLSVRAVPGIGPATTEKLSRLGITTIAALQQASLKELTHELGTASGLLLHELAFGRDERPVCAVREAKSISVEDTFLADLTELELIQASIDRDVEIVAARLAKAGLFARTVTLKIRLADFTTYTRSRTLDGATDRVDRIDRAARALLHSDLIDLTAGVRLLGVGVSGFTTAAQEELFSDDDSMGAVTNEVSRQLLTEGLLRRGCDSWLPGLDVVHDKYGRGWVWGSGRGVVTVRFETRYTGIGRVRSFRADDPALQRADLLPLVGVPNEESRQRLWRLAGKIATTKPGEADGEKTQGK